MADPRPLCRLIGLCILQGLPAWAGFDQGLSLAPSMQSAFASHVVRSALAASSVCREITRRGSAGQGSADKDAPVHHRKGRETMRRGLFLFVGLGLLGLLTGCNHASHCRGVCDCQVAPIDHCTPSPIVKPAVPITAAPPLAPTTAP